MSQKVHFRGLDSLRFLAALFVVIGHIPMNQGSARLPSPNWGAFFYRGAPAVSFFFTLSGFLITYLLLEEHRRTGTIAVRSFYLRRVCRIWPLYFAVVAFGLLFYNLLLPRLGIHYPVLYSLPTALFLYTFFLPNLMNSLYTVGGILNPLWSIGVEEQFYLAWAPAVKRCIRVLPRLCAAVLAASLAVYFLNRFGVFGSGRQALFWGQLKFHFMAAGALCAWALHRHRDKLLALPVFTNRGVQIVLFLLLLEYYSLGRIPWNLGEELVQLVFYPWLILTVAANPRNVIRLENRVFEYLGTISYGIYMLHMIAVYATSKLFAATSWWHGHIVLYCAAYYTLAIGLTILLAASSYRWFERPFLRLKERRFATLPSTPERRRLVYLCDWLPPDFGAVGQYSLLFARQRAAAGEEVTLAGLSSTADSVTEEGTLRIVRLRTTVYDKADFRRRALWTLRTNLSLLWRLRREIAAADEVLFTGSPPFLIHLLVPANVFFRRRLTYRITDLHPECLMAELGRVPAPLRLFHRLTVLLRRRVHRFEVLGEDQRRRLLEIGIAPDRIILKRDPSPVEIPPGTPPLDVPEELRGFRILLYSGNFGVAHDHETFLEGYRRHHRRPSSDRSGRVALWLNATGAKADRVEEILRREGLPVHRSRPVPLDLLPRLLVTPDAHLITLRDEFVGYVLPSKVHACIRSGRRVLFVGSERSDVHLLCVEGLPAERYRRVDAGDPDGVAQALEEIGQSLK
ncbi:MAG TPA: acyltransferase family protein [Thermoanaerobaculia bacterium]